VIVLITSPQIQTGDLKTQIHPVSLLYFLRMDGWSLTLLLEFARSLIPHFYYLLSGTYQG
jgi:hypothetical protein